MKNNSNYRSVLTVISLTGILFFLFLRSNTSHDIENKQKGAHVFGHLDSTNVQTFVNNNIQWITLVSFGDQKDFDSPTMVYYRGDSLENVQRDSAWKSQIGIAHAAGMKVFLKPHIWINNPSNGKWRSDIFPTSESNWQLWQKNYREFILLYAAIAEKSKVEMFCIGAEFSRLSVEKSAFWRSLIKDVRLIYNGKLTYAANWHGEFEKITFWDELDFIGIQAYFPLVKNTNPRVDQISAGWNQYFPSMESMANKFQRKILFTEMGYKSTHDAATEPWKWIENYDDVQTAISDETQANCYEAFFKTVWKKEWFAGVHIWQLRSDFNINDGHYLLDFTPQGKSAENIIAKGFE